MVIASKYNLDYNGRHPENYEQLKRCYADMMTTKLLKL